MAMAHLTSKDRDILVACACVLAGVLLLVAIFALVAGRRAFLRGSDQRHLDIERQSADFVRQSRARAASIVHHTHHGRIHTRPMGQATGQSDSSKHRELSIGSQIPSRTINPQACPSPVISENSSMPDSPSLEHNWIKHLSAIIESPASGRVSSRPSRTSLSSLSMLSDASLRDLEPSRASTLLTSSTSDACDYNTLSRHGRSDTHDARPLDPSTVYASPVITSPVLRHSQSFTNTTPSCSPGSGSASIHLDDCSVDELGMPSSARTMDRRHDRENLTPFPSPTRSRLPSALKGSPTARQGPRLQTCVRISRLTPVILGPVSEATWSAHDFDAVDKMLPKPCRTGDSIDHDPYKMDPEATRPSSLTESPPPKAHFVSIIGPPKTIEHHSPVRDHVSREASVIEIPSLLTVSLQNLVLGPSPGTTCTHQRTSMYTNKSDHTHRLSNTPQRPFSYTPGRVERLAHRSESQMRSSSDQRIDRQSMSPPFSSPISDYSHGSVETRRGDLQSVESSALQPSNGSTCFSTTITDALRAKPLRLTHTADTDQTTRVSTIQTCDRLASLIGPRDMAVGPRISKTIAALRRMNSESLHDESVIDASGRRYMSLGLPDTSGPLRRPSSPHDNDKNDDDQIFASDRPSVTILRTLSAGNNSRPVTPSMQVIASKRGLFNSTSPRLSRDVASQTNRISRPATFSTSSESQGFSNNDHAEDDYNDDDDQAFWDQDDQLPSSSAMSKQVNRVLWSNDSPALRRRRTRSSAKSNVRSSSTGTIARSSVARSSVLVYRDANAAAYIDTPTRSRLTAVTPIDRARGTSVRAASVIVTITDETGRRVPCPIDMNSDDIADSNGDTMDTSRTTGVRPGSLYDSAGFLTV